MSHPVYSGIVPPLVTPLDEQGDLDLIGLERVVERTIDGGVHGVFALGTTGEGPYLPQAQRQQLVAAVCDQVRGRVPVFIGITDTVVSGSVELAEGAFAAGANAVVLAPPYYLNMTQPELQAYIERLADKISLPIMLYNMPSCCKVWIEPETVRRLSDHPRIVGLKDSSGDLSYLRTVIGLFADRPDFAFFVGPEELLCDAMKLGAHGGVNGGANLFPRLYVNVFEAMRAGNVALAESLQRLILKVSEGVYAHGAGPSRVLRGIKQGLAILDVCGIHMAEPFVAEEQPARERIEQFFRGFLPELQASLPMGCSP